MTTEKSQEPAFIVQEEDSTKIANIFKWGMGSIKMFIM